MTTLVTVGYGDITAQSNTEKIICVCLMLVGVVSFSYSTGALSSIITSYDTSESEIKEKIATLNEIHRRYKMDISLFNKLASSIRYDHNKKQKDILHFIEELPQKLKFELGSVIHKQMYASINFF